VIAVVDLFGCDPKSAAMFADLWFGVLDLDTIKL